MELGMKFRDFDQFKKACKEWGIKNRYQLHFPTNDKVRVTCACKYDGCPFWIWASAISQDDPTVQIKTIDLEHKYPNAFDNFHLGPKFIAEKYLDIFKDDPDLSVKGLVELVRKDYSYTISNKKAWRAKRQALIWVRGEEEAQYGKLLSYRAELLTSNLGSNVVIWRDGGKFLGFYVCFAVLKEAFKSGCRPLISLDGCWLKGTYGGNFLSAVAIDPNDCIFLVSYAVIAGSESKETWSWFLYNLGEDLEIRNSHHIAFMSDRQKGLIGAVKELFPEAEHRNCVRHMYQNFRQKHKGKALKDLVWNAARASNEMTFKKYMEAIEQEDKEAREWFNHPERPFHTWTRALFRTNTRCDMLLNNMCESFNRYIYDARDKAIITMLDMIKNMLMKRLYKKREWIEKYQGVICPKIMKKLNLIRQESIHFRTDYSGGPKVLVDGPGGTNVVDLVAKSCTCRRWDLTGLPCPHAYASIIGNNEGVENYVNTFYTVEMFKNVYSYYINPTNPEDHWPKVVNCGEVLPPKSVKKKRGRPPNKVRRKEAEELEKKKKADAARNAEKRAEKLGPQKLSKKGFVRVKCSICKNFGHNARGHDKFVKSGQSSSSHHFDPIVEADFEESWDRSNVYVPFMSKNNLQEFKSTNQSTIIQGATKGVDVGEATRRSVQTGFVDEGVQIEDITNEAAGSSISKRGRQFKRKVMKEYVLAVQKKKTRNPTKI